MADNFDPVGYINTPRWQASRYGLERTEELLNRMGRPQDKLRFVHVAGTNGKGSVCAYVAQVLKECGYRTGLFTSPYIVEFSERIRVDGANISDSDLLDVTLFVRDHAEAMEHETGDHPTEFELMTAVAFEHFARSGCDIVVCEVGLGGRLDSTNIIDAPEVCTIVRIGLDHTELLGDTPAAIAGEKAGIIKRGASVVSWPQDDPGAMKVIEDAATAVGSKATVPDFSRLSIGHVKAGVRSFEYKGTAYTTKLLGSYQPYNASLAIEVLHALAVRGWNIPEAKVVSGVADTVWPARFEVVQSGEGIPTLVVDGGHNPQGAEVLASSLDDVFPGQKITFVMSVLADKDYPAMIDAVLPLASAFVCMTPPSPRKLEATALAQTIRDRSVGYDDLVVEAVEDFDAAFARARELAGNEGVICAFGSLYSVGEIKAALGQEC